MDTTAFLDVHIDEKTHKVTFTIKFALADVFGTHKSGTEMSARLLGWTIKDVFDRFSSPTKQLLFFNSSIHSWEDYRFHLSFSITHASRVFTHDESKKLLEALLKHNGEYYLEIHVIDTTGTYSFTVIKSKGKPFDPEGLEDSLKSYFGKI
jgi:hypothetical protein